MTMEIKATCAALTKSGQRCRGWPDGSGFCPAHRPGAREIQVLGGKSRSRQYQLESRIPSRLRPVLDMLAKAIAEVHEGTLKPSQASAIAALASALVKISEYAELEIRLTSLEITLKKGDRRWE